MKIRSRDLGHTPFDPFFIFCLVFFTINLHAKFEVCIFSHSRDSLLGVSQNFKVGYVTQATLPCDLILYF